MKSLSLAILCLGTSVLSPCIAFAEEMPAIMVKGQLVSAAQSAWSMTALDSDEIREQAISDFDKMLRLVPGVSVRELGLGGVANNIVIRGFGNGGHGGDLGAVLDGIPLNEAMSHADGYVDLNIIVPLEVDNLTVYRGPVSALYGNYNRGGMLKIDTRKGGDYLDADASFGSFSTGDMQLALGRQWDDGKLNLAGQFYLSDGYRPQSDQQRQTLSGRIAFDIAPFLNLTLSGRYHQAEANSASYVTAAQYANNPYGIDANVQNDGAKKHFATFRADLNIALSPSASLLTFAYGTKQDFSRGFSRPVNTTDWRQREESYDRDVFGAGSSLNGTLDTDWSAAPLKYVAGIEIFRERTDYLYFDGLDRRRRLDAALNDRRTKLNSISGFAEVQAPLHRLFELSLALRADSFTGGCHVMGPEAGSDPCGKMNKVERVSPKAGVRSQVTDWMQVRVNWAEGFALPNNFVKYSVGGQALDANIFRQTEVGVKLTPLHGLLVDVAAYRLSSTDEVRTASPGIYENFGSTMRKGIEASTDWSITPRFSVRGVYSYTKTEIRNNADTSLIGNSVAGVPSHTANVDARWSPLDDWELSANWRYVGSYDVNAANTVKADEYDVLDLTLSHVGKMPFAYRAYVRIENVADNKYATSVSQIGGQILMAPAAPRGVRAGIQISL